MFGQILISNAHGSREKAFCVKNVRTYIGKDKFCDVRVEHPDIAPQHCLIISSETGYPATVRNLSENNPTLVNGRMIGASDFVLKDNDVLSIGPRKFEWKYNGRSSAATETMKTGIKRSRKSEPVAPRQRLVAVVSPHRSDAANITECKDAATAFSSATTSQNTSFDEEKDLPPKKRRKTMFTNVPSTCGYSRVSADSVNRRIQLINSALFDSSRRNVDSTNAPVANLRKSFFNRAINSQFANGANNTNIGSRIPVKVSQTKGRVVPSTSTGVSTKHTRTTLEVLSTNKIIRPPQTSHQADNNDSTSSAFKSENPSSTRDSKTPRFFKTNIKTTSLDKAKSASLNEVSSSKASKIPFNYYKNIKLSEKFACTPVSRPAFMKESKSSPYYYVGKRLPKELTRKTSFQTKKTHPPVDKLSRSPKRIFHPSRSKSSSKIETPEKFLTPKQSPNSEKSVNNTPKNQSITREGTFILKSSRFSKNSSETSLPKIHTKKSISSAVKKPSLHARHSIRTRSSLTSNSSSNQSSYITLNSSNNSSSLSDKSNSPKASTGFKNINQNIVPETPLEGIVEKYSPNQRKLQANEGKEDENGIPKNETNRERQLTPPNDDKYKVVMRSSKRESMRRRILGNSVLKDLGSPNRTNGNIISPRKRILFNNQEVSPIRLGHKDVKLYTPQNNDCTTSASVPVTPPNKGTHIIIMRSSKKESLKKIPVSASTQTRRNENETPLKASHSFRYTRNNLKSPEARNISTSVLEFNRKKPALLRSKSLIEIRTLDPITVKSVQVVSTPSTARYMVKDGSADKNLRSLRSQNDEPFQRSTRQSSSMNKILHSKSGTSTPLNGSSALLSSSSNRKKSAQSKLLISDKNNSQQEINNTFDNLSESPRNGCPSGLYELEDLSNLGDSLLSLRKSKRNSGSILDSSSSNVSSLSKTSSESDRKAGNLRRSNRRLENSLEDGKKTNTQKESTSIVEKSPNKIITSTPRTIGRTPINIVWDILSEVDSNTVSSSTALNVTEKRTQWNRNITVPEVSSVNRSDLSNKSRNTVKKLQWEDELSTELISSSQGNSLNEEASEKIITTRSRRRSSLPTLHLQKLDKSCSTRNSSLSSLVTSKVVNTSSRRSSNLSSLASQNIESAGTKRSISQSLLNSPKVDKSRCTRNNSVTSLASPKVINTSRKNSNLSSLASQNIESVRSKRSTRLSSLNSPKLGNSRSTRNNNLTSLASQNIESARTKRSISQPSLNSPKVDKSRSTRNNSLTSLVSQNIESVRPKRSNSLSSLNSPKLDHSRSTRNNSLTSLASPKVINTSSRKSSNLSSLASQNIESMNSKTSTSLSSLTSPKLNHSRSTRNNSLTSLASPKVINTSSRKSSSISSQNIESMRSKRSSSLSSLNSPKLNHSRSTRNNSLTSLASQNIKSARSKRSISQSSLNSPKVDKSRSTRNNSLTSLASPKVINTSSRKSSNLSSLASQNIESMRSKRSSSLSSLNSPKLGNSRSTRNVKENGSFTSITLPKQSDNTRPKRSTSVSSLKSPKHDHKRPGISSAPTSSTKGNTSSKSRSSSSAEQTGLLLDKKVRKSQLEPVILNKSLEKDNSQSLSNMSVLTGQKSAKKVEHINRRSKRLSDISTPSILKKDKKKGNNDNREKSKTEKRNVKVHSCIVDSSMKSKSSGGKSKTSSTKKLATPTRATRKQLIFDTPRSHGKVVNRSFTLAGKLSKSLNQPTLSKTVQKRHRASLMLKSTDKKSPGSIRKRILPDISASGLMKSVKTVQMKVGKITLRPKKSNSLPELSGANVVNKRLHSSLSKIEPSIKKSSGVFKRNSLPSVSSALGNKKKSSMSEINKQKKITVNPRKKASLPRVSGVKIGRKLPFSSSKSETRETSRRNNASGNTSSTKITMSQKKQTAQTPRVSNRIASFSKARIIKETPSTSKGNLTPKNVSIPKSVMRSPKKSGQKMDYSPNSTPKSARISRRKAVTERKPLTFATRTLKRKLDALCLEKSKAAAKKLKAEPPKSLDKKKVAAILLCHKKKSSPIKQSKKPLYSEIVKKNNTQKVVAKNSSLEKQSQPKLKTPNKSPVVKKLKFASISESTPTNSAIVNRKKTPANIIKVEKEITEDSPPPEIEFPEENLNENTHQEDDIFSALYLSRKTTIPTQEAEKPVRRLRSTVNKMKNSHSPESTPSHVKKVFFATPIADYSDVIGMKHQFHLTPQPDYSANVPCLKKNLELIPDADYCEVSGIKKALQLTPVPDYTNVSMVKRNLQVSPQADYGNVSGVKKTLELSPEADYTNVSCIKKNLHLSPQADYTNVSHLKRNLELSPQADYSNVSNVKGLLALKPVADYTNVTPMKRVFTTSPVANYTDVTGVKQMFTVPPSADYANTRGLKELFPAEDTSYLNISGVRELFKDPSTSSSTEDENKNQADINSQAGPLIGRRKRKLNKQKKSIPPTTRQLRSRIEDVPCISVDPVLPKKSGRSAQLKAKKPVQVTNEEVVNNSNFESSASISQQMVENVAISEGTKPKQEIENKLEDIKPLRRGRSAHKISKMEELEPSVNNKDKANMKAKVKKEESPSSSNSIKESTSTKKPISSENTTRTRRKVAVTCEEVTLVTSSSPTPKRETRSRNRNRKEVEENKKENKPTSSRSTRSKGLTEEKNTSIKRLSRRSVKLSGVKLISAMMKDKRAQDKKKTVHFKLDSEKKGSAKKEKSTDLKKETTKVKDKSKAVKKETTKIVKDKSKSSKKSSNNDTKKKEKNSPNEKKSTKQTAKHVVPPKVIVSTKVKRKSLDDKTLSKTNKVQKRKKSLDITDTQKKRNKSPTKAINKSSTKKARGRRK